MGSTSATPATPPAATRSGSVAAVLSAIFPGLGQAYLHQRRTAILFALPGIVLFSVAILAAITPVLAIRILDPTIALALIVVIVIYGVWWIGAVLNAWRGGTHSGVASLAAVLALLVVVCAADAYGATIIYGVRINAQGIFTGDPFLEAPPTAAPTPTPTPPGQTPDPNATPTPRPADYVDPSEEPSDPPPSILPGPTPGFDITQIDPHSDGIVNVLLVGLDWQPGRDSKRTDTLVVVSANSTTGELIMFSFPRDSAQFPLYNGGTYSGKINTFAGYASRSPDVYPDGGMKSLSYEIGYLLGIPIDYYASVDMPGFVSVVQAVGGVTITNTRDIHDDTLQFYLAPGTYRLSPEDTLRYVRTRHGSGGDFGRAERQQQVLTALRSEFMLPQNVARLPELVAALSNVIHTDFPPEQVDQLIVLANEVEVEPKQRYVFSFPDWADHVPISLTGGRSVIFLRMDKIAALSIQIFGDKSLWNGRKVPKQPPLPTPTPVAPPTPSPIGPANPGSDATPKPTPTPSAGPIASP